MPEHASRFAGLYDQQNENRIPDWGGDELFTRMPTPRAVDDAPAPRFRPSLVVVDSPAAEHEAAAAAPRDRRRAQTAQESMIERAERLGLSVVEDMPDADEDRDGLEATIREWDTKSEPAYEDPRELDERAPNGRRTKVITGRPEGAPRPLSLVPAERRRPARTPAEWIGPRPERIVAWAFVLGLLLILVAISTADAATL